jgi:hypothetical protein
VRITLQPAYTEKDAKAQGMTRMEARRYAECSTPPPTERDVPGLRCEIRSDHRSLVAWDSPTLTDQRRSGLTVDDVVRALWAALDIRVRIDHVIDPSAARRLAQLLLAGSTGMVVW